MSDCILILGTGDTKSDEMAFLADCLKGQGANAITMDVGILKDPTCHVDITRHDVAEAAGTTNAEIIALGDENKAMAKTSVGASQITRQLYDDNEVHGVIILGGTMGTDLALDVCDVLPMGFPKIIVSTVAFSPLLPPERISPDVMMILWAGGLYGLNAVCKSSLSQAAGAVLGAARAVVPPKADRPMIGMTSLGSSSLKYMKKLKPELEARGFDLAIFHTTGLGGRAFETLAKKGAFACVMDFSLVEVSNGVLESPVNSGDSRLTGAGLNGTPQIVAPGGVSLVDMRAWADIPAHFQGREFHAHNRLITCALMNKDEKAKAGQEISARLNAAKGPTFFIMPIQGVDEWDRPGGPFRDPDGLKALGDAVLSGLSDTVHHETIDAHINDDAFAQKALDVFDHWCAEGVVKSTRV